MLNIVAISVVLCVLFQNTCFSEQPDTDTDLEELRGEIEALKRVQTAIQHDVLEIRDLLQEKQTGSPEQARSPQAPARKASEDATNLVFNVEGRQFQGETNAVVTIIEFFDYGCGPCAFHNRDTFPSIEKEYIRKGTVKYVFWDLPPGEDVHAAAAAHCAGEQSKFLEMHSRLFANGGNSKQEALMTLAKDIGIETNAFKACIESGQYISVVDRNRKDAMKAGFRNTPVFVLGLTDPTNSAVRAVRVLNGARFYQAFKPEIDRMLAKTKTTPAKQ